MIEARHVSIEQYLLTKRLLGLVNPSLPVIFKQHVIGANLQITNTGNVSVLLWLADQSQVVNYANQHLVKITNLRQKKVDILGKPMVEIDLPTAGYIEHLLEPYRDLDYPNVEVTGNGVFIIKLEEGYLTGSKEYF